MKRICISALIVLALEACGGTTNEEAQQLKDSLIQQADSVPEKDNIKTAEDSTRRIAISLKKDTIQLPVLKDSIVASGYLKGMGQHVVFIVPVKRAKTLYAELQAPDTANIRINQIITPAGKADGPFQKQHTFSLKEEGNYLLVIGENQMAEGAWSGDFKIKIALR